MVSNLYLVLVGENWRTEYENTVSSPVSIDASAPEFVQGMSNSRFWGATTGEGNTKQDHFNEMGPTDLILFHDGSVVFATGVPGEKFDPDKEGPALGDWLWDTTRPFPRKSKRNK